MDEQGSFKKSYDLLYINHVCVKENVINHEKKI